MRRSPKPVVERGRIDFGPLASTEDYGTTGAFVAKVPGSKSKLKMMASDGMGWEHVSVSVMDEERCPTWEEMAWVKDQFWKADECVVQYHPSKEDYVNCHNYCLHLWRPLNEKLPRPLPEMVGPKI